MTVAVLLWACGGTTGHDGDPASTGIGDGADATVGSEGGLDANVTYDAGLFDVDIPYANRALPDVGAPAEAGQGSDDAGYPNCPPWLPVDSTGNVVDADTLSYTFVAADYAVDGGVVAAAEGGACATYPWLPGYDLNCVANQNGGDYADPFPPCNWAIGLGKAQAGPAAGSSRYDLCMNLYACIQASGCWRAAGDYSAKNALASCFCGSFDDAGQEGCQLTPPAPTGVCKQQIQDAFELPDLGPSSVKAILANYEVDLIPNFGSMNLGLTAPDYGSALLNVYATAALANPTCVTDAGAD